MKLCLLALPAAVALLAPRPAARARGLAIRRRAASLETEAEFVPMRPRPDITWGDCRSQLEGSSNVE